MAGPLAGITILEMAGIGPGPFACMMLADMGARVIRIDRVPSGPASGFGAMMRYDSIVDRGRQSIAVNMKDARGVETVLKLVESADVLIEGFRPGVMEKLGLGPHVCHGRNGRLIYGRMTGWGQSGPLAHAAGHDLNYIAVSGALHAMGASDRPPAPPLNLVGDYGGGGMFLALGVVAALFEARQSGRGQVIDAAMSDGAAMLMSPIYGMMAKGVWTDRRESNFLDGAAHFYGTYECSDGRYISIGSIEPQFYRLLLDKCGIEDAQFEKQWEHGQWPALKARLAEMFRSRTRDQWCELLEGSDVCFAPVLSMKEAPHHPHNVARKTFLDAGGIAQPAPAPRFDRTPSEAPGKAPPIGAHSVALLGEIGYDAKAIEHLLAQGVVYHAS